MADRADFRIRVFGRVQGVGYRAWCRDAAQARGLKGWAKNENDGSVTVVLSGPPDDVNAMIEALSEGPAAASVDSTQVNGEASPPDAPGFEIRR